MCQQCTWPHLILRPTHSYTPTGAQSVFAIESVWAMDGNMKTALVRNLKRYIVLRNMTESCIYVQCWVCNFKAHTQSHRIVFFLSAFNLPIWDKRKSSVVLYLAQLSSLYPPHLFILVIFKRKCVCSVFILQHELLLFLTVSPSLNLLFLLAWLFVLILLN